MTVALGEVPVGTTADATFTLTNVGGGELEVLSTTFSDGDPDLWRLATDGGPTLAGGESMTLVVTFEPEREDSALARVRVRSTDEATGPVTVEITGEGSPSIADDDEDGYSPAQGDCNDNRDDVYPGAPELCDGRDNDCNDVVPANEDDDDNDGWRVCEDDCDDGDRDVHPGAVEICDQKDSDCSGDGNQDDADVDGDGVSICEGDCDDGEEDSFPGNPEVCGDQVDNDCSGVVDDLDDDEDGHSVCHPAGDCNDDDDNAFPVVVDASAAAGGDGTDEAPFADFASALAALDGTCRTIWLADGDYEVQATLAAAAAFEVVGESGTGVVLGPPGGSGRILVVPAGASITLRDLTLAGADSAGDGGAVNVTGGSITLEDIVVRDNACAGDGAGASVSGGSLTVTGGRFGGNEAGDDGGAIALQTGSVTIDGGWFEQNSGTQGGAIYGTGGTLSIHDTLFDGNAASTHGGAVFLEDASLTVEILRSALWRNTAGGNGGGLACVGVDDDTGLVANNRFQNNTATGNGGAAWFGGDVAGLSFVNNTMHVNNADDGANVYIDATDASTLVVVSNIGSWGNVSAGNFGYYYFESEPNAEVSYNLAFTTSSGLGYGGVLTVDFDDNLYVAPGYVDASDDGDPTNDDLTIDDQSPAWNSGPPAAEWDDCDGSQNDRGYTGGPYALEVCPGG